MFLMIVCLFGRDYFFQKQCNFSKKNPSNTALIYFYSFFWILSVDQEKHNFYPNEQKK